jgi:AcrR family transcriptional regulator
MMEKLSRKERERLARRAEILDAAKKVFAKKGYHEATIAEIATEAELAQGTIYLYFESKDHLFFSLIEEKIDELTEAVSEVIESDEEDTIKKIENVVRTQLEFFENDKDFFTLLSSERSHRFDLHIKAEQKQWLKQRYHGYVSLVAKPIETAIMEGKLKAMDKDKLAYALIGMVSSLISQSILMGKEEGLTANLHLIMEIFLKGAGRE